MGAASQEFENWQRENKQGIFAPPPPDKDRGMYPKYEVKKLDDPEGKHDDCPFFVLDLKHDPIARRAARVYAYFSREEGYEKFAEELDAKVTVYEP